MVKIYPTTMSNSITSLLGIQGWWKILDIKEEKKSIHLFLKRLRKTATCVRCGKRTKTGYDRQTSRSILHTTIGSKLVYIHISPRRFVCICSPSKPFREDLELGKKRRATTKQFDQELIKHLSGQAFKTVERKYTLSYPSVRNRLFEAVNPMDIRWDRLEGLSEIHLGLDAHHLVNKQFCETITEVKQRIPLGILPNSKKITILLALKSIPENLKDKVKSVCVDIDQGTIAIIQKLFPNVSIVIDHYHVIQDANRRLNEARLIEQEVINQERAKKGLGRIEIPIKLLRRRQETLDVKEQEQVEKILSLYPNIRVWHVSKERLRDVYKAKDRKEADVKLKSLISSMRSSDDIALYQWGNMLLIHKEEILNYFLYKTTNAYTEGLHVRCKLVQRISSGFRNPQVYVRKALLSLLPLSVAITNLYYVAHYPL